MSIEDAERVLKLQHEAGLRFGDAAQRLKLVNDEDIDFALASQFDYTYLSPGRSAVDASVVAAYSPFSPAVERLRALRSQLMLRGVGGGGEHKGLAKGLAVLSTRRGDGRTWLAANLAVAFTQIGQRVLLVDADMRNGRLHRLFAVEDKLGLSSLLAGRVGSDAIQRVTDLPGLSVLSAGARPPNPQELLSRSRFEELLARAASAFDLVIFDTPAVDDFADAYAVARHAGTAVLVARKNVSRARAIASLAEGVQEVGASLVGAVVNER
ncbi:polysaccharide biosynthesis tyrosine autokinase [Niveibacterium sp. SC-1]|uniref:polysaccharide biosynthesis tyrosine autokinase n=1 Tax=Niveibacterium sp. SC-1 TaxID=3135646 RepID=UPI00311F0C06